MPARPAKPAATTADTDYILAPADLTRLQAPIRLFNDLEADLRTHLVEREEAIRLALCALIAGQHTIMIGPPGVAKSYLTFLLARSLTLTRFVQLLTRYSTVEDLMGPISLSGLKQDNYYRLTTSRAPEAQVLVFDEVFKANASLLNCTLSLLNERVFDNGGQRIDTPLISLYGASNEIPQSPELAAIYDRFQCRIFIDYISAPNFPKFLRMRAAQASASMLRVAANNKAITLQLPPPKVTIDQHDLFQMAIAAAQMPIPGDVLDRLCTLYTKLGGIGIRISDRRWEQALDLIRAHALLEGRPEVDADDLDPLKHAFWNSLEQRQQIGQFVAQLANPLNASANELLDQAISVYETVVAAQKSGDPNLAGSRAVIEANEKLVTIRKTLKKLFDQATQEGAKTDRIKKIGQRVRDMNEAVAAMITGQQEDML